MSSTKQNKVARLVQKELAEYFRLNSAEYEGKMISVTVVRMTPDLLEARVYLSIFPNNNQDEILKLIEMNNKKIRHYLGQKIRFQVRRIPELKFFIDDSLDYAQKIDDLLKK